MRFWDASAIVPLIMTEATTKPLQGLAAADPALLVWWGTEVECASAIARLEREGALDSPAVIEAFDRLKRLAEGWHEVDPPTLSERPRSASYASMLFPPPTACNSPPPSSLPNGDRRHSNWLLSTTVWPLPLAGKALR